MVLVCENERVPVFVANDRADGPWHPFGVDDSERCPDGTLTTAGGADDGQRREKLGDGLSGPRERGEPGPVVFEVALELPLRLELQDVDEPPERLLERHSGYAIRERAGRLRSQPRTRGAAWQ